MSSSSSEGLFVYKQKAAAVFLDSTRQAGGAAEHRPARRPEQPPSKRARTRAIVLDDDEEEEEDEEPAVIAVDVAAPVAKPAPADADESAWLLPPPASARPAVVLSEEELKLLRRTQQTLEELQRPVYEEPEKPAPPQQLPAAPAPPAVKLAIFLRDVSGDKQKFIIKSDTKFEAVFDAYCAARTLEPASVCFFFDGDVVSRSATPATLDMADDDCVDVKRV